MVSEQRDKNKIKALAQAIALIMRIRLTSAISHEQLIVERDMIEARLAHWSERSDTVTGRISDYLA